MLCTSFGCEMQYKYISPYSNSDKHNFHHEGGNWFNNDRISFVWFDRPGESGPEKDCCW